MYVYNFRLIVVRLLESHENIVIQRPEPVLGLTPKLSSFLYTQNAGYKPTEHCARIARESTRDSPSLFLLL